MKNNFDCCNAAQLMAIHHADGPAIVLAGPGSGKTRVIVERLKFLIEEKKVSPSSILVITFTRAAANEMQQRFMKITDSSYPEVNFGTFHSCFFQIIRWGNSKDKKLNIADESFRQKIMRNILLELSDKNKLLKEDLELGDDIVKEALSEISRVKNSAALSKSCDLAYSFSDEFPYIYDKYNEQIKEFGKLDFDDMILICLRMLEENADLLRKCRESFKYFLIDEYQDINLMQFRVLELLWGDEKNVFAVGDDDQAIYGFRGSEPEIMLGFKRYFENLGCMPVQINLSINYRCGKEILNNSLLVIEENKNRYKKSLTVGSSTQRGAVLPLMYTCRERENAAIAHFLEHHKENLSQIAIICRTNAQCNSIAGFLAQKNLPTNLSACSGSFIESSSVMAVIDYINFSCSGKREFFLRIMNKPLRYISRECAANEYVKESDVIRYYKNNKAMKKTVNDFFRQINMISHLRPNMAIRYIRKEVGIDRLFPNEKSHLDELESLSREYQSVKSFLAEIKSRAENVKNLKVSPSRTKGNCAKLLTMHASKGLEYEIVWIPGLNEGIIPSRGAMSDKHIEEERRMLYVAMTRAKRALIMSYVTGSEENPMMPSRFLRPIKHLWEEKYSKTSQSSPSSGSSIISSNSTSSRYRLNASATASYSASSLMYPSSGSEEPSLQINS